MRVFLKMALLAQINYIGNFIGHIVVEILSQAITLLFLVTVFSYTDNIKGWTFDSSVFVFYLAIVVVLTAECFTPSINSYYRILAQGRLDPYLTLPVQRVKLMILRWSEPGYLIPVVVVLALWPLVGSDRVHDVGPGEHLLSRRACHGRPGGECRPERAVESDHDGGSAVPRSQRPARLSGV